jgi:hypothetical protein
VMRTLSQVLLRLCPIFVSQQETYLCQSTTHSTT